MFSHWHIWCLICAHMKTFELGLLQHPASVTYISLWRLLDNYIQEITANTVYLSINPMHKRISTKISKSEFFSPSYRYRLQVIISLAQKRPVTRSIIYYKAKFTGGISVKDLLSIHINKGLYGVLSVTNRLPPKTQLHFLAFNSRLLKSIMWLSRNTCWNLNHSQV